MPLSSAKIRGGHQYIVVDEEVNTKYCAFSIPLAADDFGNCAGVASHFRQGKMPQKSTGRLSRVTDKNSRRRDRIMALAAAMLGWMFDGFEMGLFPVVARPALHNLLVDAGAPSTDLEGLVGQWNSLAIAAFLLGAATGGVLFGWLGDRFGRVRALTLSILVYALVSGAGAFALAPWHIVVVRFVAALGMGGEWALGVALVMEVWRGRSRVVLAGLVGTSANVGFALVAWLSLGLDSIRATLSGWGLSEQWVSWRLLMVCGVLPALVTLGIRFFVRESQAWEAERARGETKAWATSDLWGVLLGGGGGAVLLLLWSLPLGWVWRAAGSLVAFSLLAIGFLAPAARFLGRTTTGQESRRLLGRMILGASLAGVPLIGTWAAVQWAPIWGDQIAQGVRTVKSYTQVASALGAVVGTFLGALLAGWLGRRRSYALLCLASLASVWLFYLTNREFSPWFLATAALMGGVSASFYGWLPVYLPELFPTKIRATGQGFCYNFGRIFAAVGALQTGEILSAFSGGYPQACSTMAVVYVLGLLIVVWAPESTQAEFG